MAVFKYGDKAYGLQGLAALCYSVRRDFKTEWNTRQPEGGLGPVDLATVQDIVKRQAKKIDDIIRQAAQYTNIT